MEAVTLPQSRALTRADLETMPDDGHRYELIDGTLLVTPSPARRHQRAAFRLARLLDDAASDDLEVLMAPFDVVLGDDTVLQPDVLVAPRAAFTDRDLPGPPLLAVEVLSPSTRLFDLNTKRARYELAGCPTYWVVDPAEPGLTVWELRDGRYAETAHASGAEAVTIHRPFPVVVVPAALVG